MPDESGTCGIRMPERLVGLTLTRDYARCMHNGFITVELDRKRMQLVEVHGSRDRLCILCGALYADGHWFEPECEGAMEER